MEKKKFKLGLFPKLIIAIIIGILFGQFLPVWFCRIVVTLSSIFSTFLSFIIPLMILAYVTMGIANLKSGAGKLLLITVILAYLSTLAAGSASFLVADTLFPSFMRATSAWRSRPCSTPSRRWCWPLCWACACPPCGARPSATPSTTG